MTIKKIITSACPVCHGRFTEDFTPEKYEKKLAERYMFKRLIGVKCPNCVKERWLLGTIEDVA